MSRDNRNWRSLLALTLIAGLPALNCAISILDLMVGDGTHAVEAKHHPGTHGFAHNHLICIQQQANQWVMPSNDLLPAIVSAISLPISNDSGSEIPINHFFLPHSRAPPLA